MKNLKEATKYVCESIKNLSNEETIDEVQYDIIHDILLDVVLEKYEDRLNELDVDLLSQDFMDDDKVLEEFLKVKFSDYEDVLEEAVKKVVTEYVVEDQTAPE